MHLGPANTQFENLVAFDVLECFADINKNLFGGSVCQNSANQILSPVVIHNGHGGIDIGHKAFGQAFGVVV